MNSRIVSIIPADGWFAVYLNEDQTTFAEPLAAWALLEELDPSDDEPTNYRKVEGLAVSGNLVESAEEYQPFHAYTKDPESYNTSDALSERRREAAVRQRKERNAEAERIERIKVAIAACHVGGRARIVQVRQVLKEKYGWEPSADALVRRVTELNYRHDASTIFVGPNTENQEAKQ